jgi:serine/threonine-protein kinase
MLEIGQQVGAYTIVRRIGAGGMAEVFMGQHRHIDRTVAIKVLKPEISMQQEGTARFFAEARAASSIKHAGIVEILDCDVLPDGRAYIVMEYLTGQSLRQFLADRPPGVVPDFSLIARVLVEVAEALGAAHAKGIVHRDLKPDNVFLVHDEGGALAAVKVLDFGIAKLMRGIDGVHQTRTGSLLGTPLYMSPEQCRGITEIDHRADLYSLGCLAFELVSGRPPFLCEAPGDLLMAHMSQPPPPLSSHQPATPPELEALVTQMLAKAPRDRPASMRDVIGRLSPGRLRGGDTMKLDTPSMGDALTAARPRAPWEPTPARRSRPAPLSVPQTSTTLSRSSAEMLSPAPPRRRWPAVGVGLLVVGGAALLLLWPRPPSGQRSEPIPLRTTPASGVAPVRHDWPVTPPAPPAEEVPSPEERTRPETPSGTDSRVAAPDEGKAKRPSTRSKRRTPAPKKPAGDDYRYIED